MNLPGELIPLYNEGVSDQVWPEIVHQKVISYYSISGLEIRPVFAKLRFWVCRTLEFFAWVFEKNQGFLKKSYVNWSRILRLVNRFWIFIGISNDSFIEITLRSFLLIFRFFCLKFCRILEFYSWVIEFFPWVLSFFLLEFFSKCRISKPALALARAFARVILLEEYQMTISQIIITF